MDKLKIDESRNLLEKRFPPRKLYGGGESLWAAIDDWQDKILEKRPPLRHAPEICLTGVEHVVIVQRERPANLHGTRQGLGQKPSDLV